MSFDTFLKSRVTDRVLSPIRETIAAWIPPASRVLEIGFGTGDLLFRLAPKISEGVGLELADDMIEFARERQKRMSVTNLQFHRHDTTVSLEAFGRFDVATATLTLHELHSEEAVRLLQQLPAPCIVIGDFDHDQKGLERFFTHVDEFMAGHRDRYVEYERNGGLPALLDAAGYVIDAQSEKMTGSIRVWKCRRLDA